MIYKLNIHMKHSNTVATLEMTSGRRSRINAKTSGSNPSANHKVAIPKVLSDALRQHGASSAFDKLTPGKRREYAEYFEAAKQDSTK